VSVLVAVTGGAGFIGGHLAEGFLKKGYEVRIIDNLTTGTMVNLARPKTKLTFESVMSVIWMD
jgi:nucleoside-diphosphate-sugar epimerase